jgi:hypothetical protein
MQPASRTEMMLSREAWTDLLTHGSRAPEVEPPVRRRSRRYGAAALGTGWRILHQKGHKALELRGKLTNASAEGVMLFCRSEVPRHAPVLVAFTSFAGDECAVGGEVRHCTGTVGGYKVGVQLHFSDAAQRCAPRDPRRNLA